MQLTHEFTVPADRATAWSLLGDVRRMAACLPGAEIDTVEGDRFTGRFTVKLGPIRMAYAGTARFELRDAGAGRIELAVQGRDPAGRGTARATMTITLVDGAAGATPVAVATELDLTGRPAQLGGPLISEVGDRLVAQFAANLTRALDPTETEPPGRDSELDLLAIARGPIGRWSATVTAVLVAVGAAWWTLKSRGPTAPRGRRARRG